MDPHAASNESIPGRPGQAKTRTRSRSMQSSFQPALFRMHESDRERAQTIFKELAKPILAFRPRYHFHRATDDKLHGLRISAKKLRYAMELFAPLWPQGLKDKIADARALQDTGGQYHDWCVLCETLKAEIRRSHKGDNGHLAFQIGRLLALAEDRKAELRKNVLPAITTLQSTLRLLLPDLGNELERNQLLTAAAEFERK
jgi:CHAD domain-containing protein